MAAREDPRTVRRETLAAAKAHTMVQGEIVYAANLLHDAFFEVFAEVIGLERGNELGGNLKFRAHALALWHIIQSDSAQREMAFAALSSIPTSLKLKPAIERLNWATKRAAKLAEYRNLVAHSPVMFGYRKEGDIFAWGASFAGYGLRPSQVRRLSLIDGLRFWETIRDDLLAVASYVRAVKQQIQRLESERKGAELIGVPSSWPRRPRLRSLPRLQEIDRLSAPAPKNKRPRRRPRSPSR